MVIREYWLSMLMVDQTPFVQKVDSPIHGINHHPVDSAISFCDTYLLDSNLPVDSTIQLWNNRGRTMNWMGALNKPLVILEVLNVKYI